jgi:hypothetical protein
MEMGVTPDRWHFFSDPAVASDGSTHPTDIPNGLIKIDFGVETVANLLPEPKVRNPFVDELGQADRDDLIPLLPPGTWTTVGDMPALLLPANEKMLTEGHGGDFTKSISIYILGEQLVYYFWVAYAPPNNGDALPVNEYDKIIAHLLESFTADPKPLAGWYPVEQSS